VTGSNGLDRPVETVTNCSDGGVLGAVRVARFVSWFSCVCVFLAVIALGGKSTS
jgi:hypothetical protein